MTSLRASWGWSTPGVSTSLPGHDADAPRVSIDKVRAAAAAKGVSGPVQITLPAQPGQAYVVSQVKRSWPEKQDSAAVDPVTGKVTSVQRFADWPLPAKLARWGVDAHMGLLFGLANQLLLASLALALICLLVWGYRMWWYRRPTTASDWGWGRTPARGVWRRIPVAVLVPFAAFAVFVAYFLPELGVSLLLFLVLDVVLGLRASRRAIPSGRAATGPRSTGRDGAGPT